MELILQAGFDVFSGYGRDAVDMAVALERHGVRVTPLPTEIMPGLPREFARLLERDPRGKKDVAVRFSDPIRCKSWRTTHLAPVSVMYTTWDRTPLLPEDLAGDPEWEDRGKEFTGWDKVLVTCPMNISAFRSMVPEPTPIEVVPRGIEPKWYPEKDRAWHSDRFQFLSIGRNPDALLDAWTVLKRERPDFTATLRLHGPGLQGTPLPDCEITEQPMTGEQTLEMYHKAHVLVAADPGNDKPPMEFMATGGTVIASDWASHQNWLFPDAVYPVDGRLAPVPGQDKAMRFETDRQALKRALLTAWEDRAGTRRKAQMAARLVRESMSWDHVTAQMVQRIARLL